MHISVKIISEWKYKINEVRKVEEVTESEIVLRISVKFLSSLTKKKEMRKDRH